MTCVKGWFDPNYKNKEDKMKNKITFIIGTKAELIKCMPVMLELQRQDIPYYFLHTGQHNLGEACKEFRIKKPDYVLSKEPEKSTKFWSKINSNSISWCFSMLFKIKKIINKIQPSYVIYHGDTMSSSIAAMASSKLFNFNKTWKNVHLEAGLRSGSLFEPFPEEISRRICDWFSDVLFAVSDFTEDFLHKRYGTKNKEIIQVGNTIIDSTKIIYDKIKDKKTPLSEKYALINIHRHENLKSKKRMRKIVNIIKNVSIPVIWPLHDNTQSFLEKYNLMEELENMDNLKIVPLMNYSEFIFLIASCKYLITDGGSIQEESLVFKKPCVLLRNVTERQEGLATGINFLTNFDEVYAKEIIENIESNKIHTDHFENPYGKVGISKEIVEILK